MLVDIEIKKNREFQLLQGHPWVYKDAIRKFPSDIAPGTIAQVFTHRQVFLGLGLVDPSSAIAVRLLSCPAGQTWPKLLLQRLVGAVQRRLDYIDLRYTNAFRLLNGEGDGLPGLVIDCYHNILVIAVYTDAWNPWLPIITDCLLETFPQAGTILVRRPTSGVHGQKVEYLHGQKNSAYVRIIENGMKFRVNLEHGQKTGFFLDQRDNRALLRTFARGRTVANVCGYTGGFSVSTALGGAHRTLTIDSAGPALEDARYNFELNGLSDKFHGCQCTDMYQWLETPVDRDFFDFIILDPPSMTRNKADCTQALRAYTKLNTLAATRLPPHGLLFTASCSSQITRDDFLTALRNGIGKAKRQAVILQETAHAFDHPIALAHPEGRYLKGFLLEVF